MDEINITSKWENISQYSFFYFWFSSLHFIIHGISPVSCRALGRGVGATDSH